MGGSGGGGGGGQDPGGGGGGGGQDPGGGGGGGGQDPGGGGGGSQGVVLLSGQTATSACHGSPAGEGVGNLSDGNPMTKFLGFGSSMWASFDAGEPEVVSRYAITSANDAPERDPKSWILAGSNDGVTWVPLDVHIGEDFAARFERHEFSIENHDFYRYYLLRMENHTGGVTQVGELELYGETPFTQAASAPPAAASGLTATAASHSQIDLSWQDNAGDETLFRIDQSSDGRTFTPVGYAPADATGFSVRGLPAGQSRTFRVVAMNAAGASAPSGAAGARTLAPPAGSPQNDGSVSYSQGGYTLVMNVKDPATPESMVDRMVQEFFDVYPAQAAAYNPGASHTVNVTFDPNYDGVAYATGASTIVISSHWAAGSPDDVDVVAHEGFHLVQAYNNPNAPGWAVEGLADYARYSFGTLNPGGCWTMQHYQPGQNYTDAYGVTASFLLWLTQNVRPTIAPELDQALRGNQYDASFWTSRTGKTVDQLWQAYAADPAVQPASYE